jgi:hypothetical protein
MTGRAIVLIVEDEPDVRELIADVLAETGYEIEVASDGAAALQLSDQRRYDLILSDLRMPKMDGAALYWALQLRHGAAMPASSTSPARPPSTTRVSWPPPACQCCEAVQPESPSGRPPGPHQGATNSSYPQLSAPTAVSV